MEAVRKKNPDFTETIRFLLLRAGSPHSSKTNSLASTKRKKRNQKIHLKLDVLVLEGFHIEPNGWDGLDVIVRLVLQAVEDGCLSRVVEPQDQNPDLLRSEQGLEHSAKYDPHGQSLFG